MRQWYFVQIEVENGNENEITQKYKYFDKSLSFINRINDLFCNIKKSKVVPNKLKSIQKNQFERRVSELNSLIFNVITIFKSEKYFQSTE